MRSIFYASQSAYSEPGPYLDTVIQCSGEPRHLARQISSFMQHPRGLQSKSEGFRPEQVGDLTLRTVWEILGVAAERDVGGRTPGTKVGGLCRDFAIVAASWFRSRGIPARLRAGFADYIVSGFWEDHWLCEWHDGCHWKRLDVEFAADGGMPFDASDVPPERFLTAGEAWLRIKGEPSSASLFGVSSLDLRGAWFVAGSLFRDVAALRKLELKPWDYWGPSANISWMSDEWPPGVRSTLDQVALRLKSVDGSGCGAPEALADWPLPTRVISFPEGKPVVVVLRET
ncbi:transglutaminase domain-containing protein [Rhizobium deserti]|uniref:Transglutaminase domain-containing protein n=1 Tax=Rhizobium deserti TaxID=2547961 RepID=A0A4R5UIF1_9HYPH|nr:transglutaminase domain-containing protein [Rhizobium deserti]